MNCRELRRLLQIAPLILLPISSCDPHESSHRDMIEILKKSRVNYERFDNYYAPGAQIVHLDSLIAEAFGEQDKMRLEYDKSRALIALGREEEAIHLLEKQLSRIEEYSIQGMNKVKVLLGLAYLRAGERANCILNHTSETCILPIRGTAIHTAKEGSRKAARIYQELLRENADNLEFRWLLSIAYMTLGEYPHSKLSAMMVPALDVGFTKEDSSIYVAPFENLAGPLGLDVNNMAGGSIIDDFNNDGYLDIVTSAWGLDDEMHYFQNNKDGTFTDQSHKSKLDQLTGGLNLLQMDFNNDGFKDIFVLRGAWLRGDYCRQPNSLLRNNGDGTFSDVTIKSGMLSFHPTQTATWNDFNNDGWLDVFIGNESWEGNASSGLHPAELFINNQDETFTEVASLAGCNVTGFVKGVTSGDYDNDGWQDIFMTSLSGRPFLLRNKGTSGKNPKFEDATEAAGISISQSRTFPTWFWDYDNDGWLDLLAGDFTFDMPISSYSAAEALNISTGTAGACLLYKNNRDGTFSNVSKETGLTRKAFAMGANFGDIDNDGYLDFYLGTGNPELESIVPNKLFKNLQGKKFVDITTPARVGNLQKGHAISFADLDNDGDQDIHIEMGGAYPGDSFYNSLYLNPGQDNQNKWIALDLVGTKTNRCAIGTRIRITVTENGKTRHIFRDVNSGGSFGASPLRKEIGIGRAALIDKIEIQWGRGSKQIFRNVIPNRFLRIREGDGRIEEINLNTLIFKTAINDHHHVHNNH